MVLQVSLSGRNPGGRVADDAAEAETAGGDRGVVLQQGDHPDGLSRLDGGKPAPFLPGRVPIGCDLLIF